MKPEDFLAGSIASGKLYLGITLNCLKFLVVAKGVQDSKTDHYFSVIRIYIYIYTYVCSVFMCVCVCVCVYVFGLYELLQEKKEIRQVCNASLKACPNRRGMQL